MRSTRVLGFGVALVATVAASALGVAPGASAVTPKDCGLPQIHQNGTIGPVLCRDGAPNSRARKALTGGAPRVMSLPRSATWPQVREAICGDMRFAGGTIPIVTQGYEYTFARFDWSAALPGPRTVAYRMAMGGIC